MIVYISEYLSMNSLSSMLSDGAGSEILEGLSVDRDHSLVDAHLYELGDDMKDFWESSMELVRFQQHTNLQLFYNWNLP